jgi:hypothetical protein
MIKQIPLTQGKFALVDADDYDWLSEYKWCYNSGYAARGGYVEIDGVIKHSKILMHREINHTPDGLDTDHINKDRLDNRKENLRSVHRDVNIHNANRKRNSIGLHGVRVHGNRYQSRIMLDGKSISLGSYKTESEAAKSYDNKVKEIYGEYAFVNFGMDA